MTGDGGNHEALVRELRALGAGVANNPSVPVPVPAISDAVLARLPAPPPPPPPAPPRLPAPASSLVAPPPTARDPGRGGRRPAGRPAGGAAGARGRGGLVRFRWGSGADRPDARAHHGAAASGS